MRNKHIRVIAGGGLLFLLFFSCVGDEQALVSGEQEMDKELTMTLRIPGTNVPVTYAAATEALENEVRTLDLLVFRTDSKGNEYFFRHLEVPTSGEGGGTEKTVRFRLEKMEARLVALANVRHLLTDEAYRQLEADSIAGGVTKETILRRFVFSIDRPWPTDGSRTFPMYGESALVEEKVEDAGVVEMTRAVARIDIGSAADCGLDIDSVYIFHPKDKGYVSPPFAADGTPLEEVWMPQGTASLKTPFGYPFSEPAEVGNTLVMERTIYIAEDNQEGNTPTTLVVRTLPGNGRPPVYYRVAMQGADGSPVPFRRNYRYRIHINAVTGEGYPSPAEAANAPASLETSIESNELDIHEIVVNERDRYMLGVSTSRILFQSDGTWEGQKADETAYGLKVHTTYPRWYASWNSRDFEGWLTLPATAPEGGGYVQVEFPSSVRNFLMRPEGKANGTRRQGMLTLSSGTLVIEITITRSGT